MGRKPRPRVPDTRHHDVASDRRSKSCWGNPFIVDEDGDRDTVIASYRDHFLPYKPSLARRLPELKGKVLGCWCYPKQCHGNLLIQALDRL